MKKMVCLMLDDYLLKEMEKITKKGFTKTQVIETAFKLWKENKIELQPKSFMKKIKHKLVTRVYRLSEETINYKKEATSLGVSIRMILYSGLEKVKEVLLNGKKK